MHQAITRPGTIKGVDGRHVDPKSLKELIALRPRTAEAERCDLVLFVTEDRRRVFIGGGQWGYDTTATELDDLGIEALADRFNLDDLRRVLARRKKDAAGDWT